MLALSAMKFSFIIWIEKIDSQTPAAPSAWPGQPLGRGRWAALCPAPRRRADCVDFRAVAGRGRGGMRVDVVDRHAGHVHGHAHAARAALARRRNHIVTVRGGAVADDLGVDLGAAGLGVFEFLEHQHARRHRR